MKNFAGIILFLLVLTGNGCSDSELVSPSNELTNIPVMEIFIEQSQYDYLLKNRANDAEVRCNINYKNEHYSGEIRGAGAGSRYRPKWSYKVELDDFQLLDGYDEFNLSAQVSDPTLLATSITSDLFKRLGFHVFNTSFVFLKINGEDQGLYPLIERVEEEFFEARNIDVALLYKAGFETQFSLKENYNPQFTFEKKIPDDENYNDLIELMHFFDTLTVQNMEAKLQNKLNLDNYLKYHAMTTLLNNIDAFTNNFFLYKQDYGSPFEIIPWDFDKAFFNEIVLEGIAGYNDIYGKLKLNKEIYIKYLNELDYQLENVYTLEVIENVADSVSSIIKDAYNLDPYLGFGGRFNFDEEKDKLINFVKNRRIKMKELLNEERNKL